MRLTVGLLLGGRAFVVAGETPEPPLVSLGLLRVEQPRFGGICARVIRATPGTYILHSDKQLLPHSSWLPASPQGL